MLKVCLVVNVALVSRSVLFRLVGVLQIESRRVGDRLKVSVLKETPSQEYLTWIPNEAEVGDLHLTVMTYNQLSSSSSQTNSPHPLLSVSLGPLFNTHLSFHLSMHPPIHPSFQLSTGLKRW
nr:hypothetical protein HmN_000223000 [Hymenolepis microstoma]